MSPTIHQINRKPQTSDERGIPKVPVYEVAVMANGIEGDFNRYRHEKKKDSPNMALLIMPLETIQELNEEGWPIEPGDIGENITTVGIEYKDLRMRKRFRLGKVEIEITTEVTPCTNLFVLPYVGREKGPAFIKTMLNRRGWYARVLKEGNITKGDIIEPII